MNDNPLVTICIPAYNVEKTIRKTLESILVQDYPNIEILVSDNRSTDNTAAIVHNYENRGVKYFLHSQRPKWVLNQPEIIPGWVWGEGEENWKYVVIGAGDGRQAIHQGDAADNVLHWRDYRQVVHYERLSPLGRVLGAERRRDLWNRLQMARRF